MLYSLPLGKIYFLPCIGNYVIFFLDTMKKEKLELKLQSCMVLCKYCCLQKSKQLCENQIFLLQALVDPQFNSKSESECELVSFKFEL